MIQSTILSVLAKTLDIVEWQVENTLELHLQGATVPFIARYRKERTGGLTDEQIIELLKIFKQQSELAERRESIIKRLEEQKVLTGELLKKIQDANTLANLEDIYLPYRPKRKTRAILAKEKGLELLAKLLMSENASPVESFAGRFVSVQNSVNTIDEALSGARDIIAEWINETEWVRNLLRKRFERDAYIRSKVAKGKKEEDSKYKNWFDWEEKAYRAPSHRILALFRGEKEGILKIKIIPSIDDITQALTERLVRTYTEASGQKTLAIKDALKRLLFPAMETELRAQLKNRADIEAIKVFSRNLEQLLLSPILGQKNVLAIDPGFRTGCKVVCLDGYGNLLHNETVYPHPPQHKIAMAIKKIKSLCERYQIEAIAIGNGTAGRETESLIANIRFKQSLVSVMVNEDGASVYSASAAARDEFPEYDVTVRGAVSIGRRLQDPLAELVKIDPKSLGIGQYQHDVEQKLLKESLKTTVELCVNKVGVDLNLASKELLTYISGIGPSLSEKIVEYRKKNGGFRNRKELKNVPGLGSKAFEQAAGFLRIMGGNNPLDAVAVHPENYPLVKKMAASLKLTPSELIKKKQVRNLIRLDDFVAGDVGLPTLNDIIDELEKPGRDPRKTLEYFSFDKNIRSIEDLHEGMILPAVITNITDFGAFANIGLHEKGLIHKSQIAKAFVQNPSDYLALGQHLNIKVISIDVQRKRLSLSLIGVQQ